jgi:hypothetical protein
MNTDGTGITSIHDAQVTPDGKSPEKYNRAHGRVASAPTSGGDGRGSNRSPKAGSDSSNSELQPPSAYTTKGKLGRHGG